MIVRVRFTGTHYNSGLWPNAKHGDEKVMPRPLYFQLLSDAPGQFIQVSVVSVADEIPEPQPEQEPQAVTNKPVVINKRSKRS